jgi:hypothetical protein
MVETIVRPPTMMTVAQAIILKPTPLTYFPNDAWIAEDQHGTRIRVARPR